MKPHFNREQRTTMTYGILCLLLITVILQLWLLAATMNSYLGGDDSVIWPAAVASLLCFFMNWSLLRAMAGLENTTD